MYSRLSTRFANVNVGRVVVTALFVGLLSTLPLRNALSQEQIPDEPPTGDEQIINPEVGRRPDKLPRIDTEDFEVGAFIGLYSLEDFGTEPQFGAQLAYHVTEDIFVEALYAITEVSDTTYRNIGLSLFPKEHETLGYYNLSVGFNVLPGEVFFGSRRAYTTHLYLIGGLGNTAFADEDYFTISYGIGVRVLGNDWFAVRIDFRDHVFDTDITGNSKSSHNLALQTGLTLFF